MITATALSAAVVLGSGFANAAESEPGERSAAAGEQSAAAFARARAGAFEARQGSEAVRFRFDATATTAQRTTTTTAAPAPVAVTPVTAAPAPPPPPPPPPAPVYGDPADPATWDRLAQCEASGNWAADTGNGYYGGLQFSLSSWQSVGGTGYPHQHSRETQIEMGRRLQAAQGWGAWPSCTRQLGYR